MSKKEDKTLKVQYQMKHITYSQNVYYLPSEKRGKNSKKFLRVKIK